MRKTYKTLVSSTVILVDTPHGVRQVYFRNGCLRDDSLRGSVYSTEDEEIQKGIEAHERFNSAFKNRIWTDDVEPKEEKKTQKTGAEKPVVEEKRG